MSEKAGFVVNGTQYEWPEQYELGDTIIIERITGLDFQSWAEAAGDASDPDAPVSSFVIAGMVAAAIRQAHLSWPLAKVERLVMSIDFAKFETVGDAPEADKGPTRTLAAVEGDGRPPESPGEASPESPTSSTIEPAESSDAFPPSSTGLPASPISSRA